MVIIIIRCELRVFGAGRVFYMNDITCVWSKGMWSLPRKTLYYGDEDEKQQSRNMFLET